MFAQALANGLLVGGLYALVACGVTLVFGVFRLINFAQGEFLMIGSYTVYWLFVTGRVDPLAAIPAAMLTAAGVGLLLHRTVIVRLLTAPHLNQILVTFGIALVLQNVALLAFTGNLVSVTPAYSSRAVSLGPVAMGVPQLAALVVAVTLTALLWTWLFRTETGRALRAVALNEHAARLMGVSVERMHVVAFTAAAALSGAAGALTITVTYAFPQIGFVFVLKAFAVVILGGLGSVNGALVAGMLLGLTESMVGTFVHNGGGWAEGLSFAVIVLVLAVRPQGLFGRA